MVVTVRRAGPTLDAKSKSKVLRPVVPVVQGFCVLNSERVMRPDTPTYQNFAFLLRGSVGWCRFRRGKRDHGVHAEFRSAVAIEGRPRAATGDPGAGAGITEHFANGLRC